MNKKTSAIILIAVLITTLGGAFAADQAGIFNINGASNVSVNNSAATINNSNVTIGENNTIIYPSDTSTPNTQNNQPITLPSDTPTPTQTPALQPSVNVVVVGSNPIGPSGYQENTTFTCTISVNDPSFNQLLNQLAIANMNTVFTDKNGYTPSNVINYGIGTSTSINATVSNITNGQFILTLYSWGGYVSFNESNIQSVVASAFNSWLNANR